MPSGPLACPACLREAPAGACVLVERHHDSIGGKDYEVLRCPECGVVFSEPRTPGDPEWYARVYAVRLMERRALDMDCWEVRRFRALSLPIGRLLDVGCGDGQFLKMAVQLGYRASGFDFDPRAVEEARSLGLDAWVSDFAAALDKVELRGAYDIVTVFGVLEHVPEPAAFVDGLRRFLKPGGHLVLSTPDDRRPHPGEREKLDYPPNHITRWTPSTLRAFLESRGMRVVRMESHPIGARYLSGQLFFGVLMPLLLPWAKRLLARRDAPAAAGLAGGGPARGGAGGRAGRQRLVDAAYLAFRALTLPLVWPAAVMFRLCGCGDTLFAASTHSGAHEGSRR